MTLVTVCLPGNPCIPRQLEKQTTRGNFKIFTKEILFILLGKFNWVIGLLNQEPTKAGYWTILPAAGQLRQNLLRKLGQTVVMVLWVRMDPIMIW